MDFLEPRLLLTTYTVTTADDDGPGSLRSAITLSNASTGADEIRFAIPGDGVHTISPLSPLPGVTGPLVLDGSTQPGPAANHPWIELDGSRAGAAADGLRFAASISTVTLRGMAINRFGRHGVVAAARTMTRIEASFLGTDPLGQADLGNGGAGLVIQGPATVGVPGAAGINGRNVISGNGFAGVWVRALAATAVEISSDYIGTDASGARALGNDGEGVLVEAGTVRFGRGGDLAAATVISGNGSSGVRLSGADAGNATFENNLIGTDATGTRALPNGASPSSPFRDGVTSVGASGVRVINVINSRNVVSGNAGAGISFRGGASPTVQGTYVGTDVTAPPPSATAVTASRRSPSAERSASPATSSPPTGATASTSRPARSPGRR